MPMSEWDYRGFTVIHLEKVVECCHAEAKMLRVTLHKKGSGNRRFGIIKEGNKVIFKKEYFHKFDFVNTAHMFMDFNFALMYIAKVEARTHNDRRREFGDISEQLAFYYNTHRIPSTQLLP